MRHRQLRCGALVLVAGLLAGCSSDGPQSSPDPQVSDRPSSAATSSGIEPSAAPSSAGQEPAGQESTPVRLPAYFIHYFNGSGLRLGAVRERTPDYTSYDASYRSGRLRITGVLNVPTGPGPFPAVVLAHGYIDPDYYVSGQGMTRERGYLAARGYVAFHVDYRNHAGSGVDPAAARQMRLGYSVDVINAVAALRESRVAPVDDDRIVLMGRSMGGGVVYKALEMMPGLVSAAAVWAPVSSLEAENYNRWIRGDPSRSEIDRYLARTYGLPGEPRGRRFWREISARTYFDRITEPLLIVQGGSDSTCPPRWARASYAALKEAGAEAELAWYPAEEHAFGPSFLAAMDRTVRFFDRNLPAA